jgi:hypothetical protein
MEQAPVADAARPRAQWLLVLVALLWVEPASAQTRGDSPSERQRTAVEMCARELSRREGGRSVRVDRVLRSDYRRDKVYWDGYMTVQRSGRDPRLRVACVVDFAGRNRIVSFDSATGGGSGGGWGGGDPASRSCWSEAERRGYRVDDVSDSFDAGRAGRIVTLRVDRRSELLCLYRGRPSLYRPV